MVCACEARSRRNHFAIMRETRFRMKLSERIKLEHKDSKKNTVLNFLTEVLDHTRPEAHPTTSGLQFIKANASLHSLSYFQLGFLFLNLEQNFCKGDAFPGRQPGLVDF